MRHQNLRALEDATGTWHAIAKGKRTATWCGLTITGQDWGLISFPHESTCVSCFELWKKENGEP